MATVMRYFCLHFTSVQLSRYVCSYTLFFSKDVVFPAQAEYSYFSADFRLKIFLYYSYIIAYGIFVLFRIFWAINYKCLVSGSGSCSVHCACALDTTFRSGGQDVTSKYTLYIYKMHIKTIVFFFSIRLEQQNGLIFFPDCTSLEYYVKNIMW